MAVVAGGHGRHGSGDARFVLPLQRGDEARECRLIECHGRGMRLRQQGLCDIGIEMLGTPELMARVVLGLQGLQAFDQLVLRAPVFGPHQLEGDQVGFEDVFGRRQHVGHQVLALHDALVHGPVDLQFVQHAQRPAAIHDHAQRKDGDQQGQPARQFDLAKQLHVRTPSVVRTMPSMPLA